MIAFELLAALALGELDGEEERAVEEHVLACTRCARVLEGLVIAGEAIQTLPAQRIVRAFVSRSVVERFEAAGLITRRYRLTPGATVPCTVGAHDMFTLLTLEAPLEGVARVDIEVGEERIRDVPFDPRSGLLFEVLSADVLRPLPTMRFGLRALAIERGEERVLAEYTLDHTAP